MAYKDKSQKTAYQNEYISKKYDRVNVMLPKGQKEVIKSHADQMGESVNGFITRAISEQMKRDKPAEQAER